MEQEIKDDLLAALQETIAALKAEDFASLKEISNHTIHDASIFQDQDSLSMAVLVYTIYKIVVRGGGCDRETCIAFVESLEQARDLLKGGDEEGYRATIRKLFKAISMADDRVHKYIQEVVDQAQIKKGSKLFEHGLSLATAAELLGISRWELMQYIGKTRLPEQIVGGVGAHDRIRYAKRIFGI